MGILRDRSCDITPYLRFDESYLHQQLEESAERYDAALANIERTNSSLRLCMNILSAILFTLSAFTMAWWHYLSLPPARQHELRHEAMLISIPIVALFFTWFHIWLAIQMMFRPLKFFGIWQYGETGLGIGWQGVVPRKCLKMAKMAYRCARPYLLGPREQLERVDPRVLMAKTQPIMARIMRATIASVSKKHFPRLVSADGRLPRALEDELVSTSMNRIEEAFPSLWRELTELLCDPVTGIDNDGMIVSIFTTNKSLLNTFFLKLGDKEFRFIERCGAAFGFICGIIQLVAFNHLSREGRMIFLPGTGFFLGILTNWAAIQMCFKPCFPRPIYCCGWHICDIQGLFLKRQKDVSALYSKMMCDQFFNFGKVMDYLQTCPELWSKLKAAWNQNTKLVLKQTMGRAVTFMAPLAIGTQKFQELEVDLVGSTAERIADADDLHETASRYIATATDVFRSNSAAMQSMPPDEFENLLHPVFQEDEWILVLLGGILGAIVGFAQNYFLGS